MTQKFICILRKVLFKSIDEVIKVIEMLYL